jgi:hypothetical protein
LELRDKVRRIRLGGSAYPAGYLLDGAGYFAVAVEHFGVATHVHGIDAHAVVVDKPDTGRQPSHGASEDIAHRERASACAKRHQRRAAR